MNKPLIPLLILSIAIIVVLFPHVKPSNEEPVSYLSYIIYLLGTVGIGLFYRHIIRVGKEQECADKAQKKAGDILQEIRNEGAEYDLEQLRHIGTDKYKLSTNRMIDHIKTEAESRRFDSSLTILNAYKEEFMSSFVRLASFQKIALQLGILGTFIGLSMAFRRIDTNNVDFGSLITSLKLPFSTSIAGLQVSLILWLHLDYLHQKQEKLFISLEKCIDEILNLARQAVYKKFILNELHQVGDKIDQMSSTNEKLSNQLENQTKRIAQGIESLNNAGTYMDDYLNQISEKQQQFMQSVETLYNSLSPDKISLELKTGLTETIVAMTQGLSKLEEYIEEQRKKQEVHIVNQQKEFFERFDRLLNAQQIYTEQLKNVDMKDHVRQVIANSTREISSNLDAQIQKLVSPMSTLSNTIHTQNELMFQKMNKKSFIRRFLSKN